MMIMRIPVTTYRLQFTGEFGFDEARALIPYLDLLGVTDLYASPILQAREGSEHGYDVTDPRRLNPDVGDRGDFMVLSAALDLRKMGLLLDIVPNHMAASTENPWWRDVLRWGPHSVHSNKFDLDWEAGRAPDGTHGQLILPILGAPLEEELAGGNIKLALGPDGFEIRYHDQHLPVCPGTYHLILAECIQKQVENHGEQAALRQLADLAAPGGSRPKEAAGPADQAGQKLWELYRFELPVRECVDQIIESWNRAGENSPLAKLLARQYYRPAYWREARHKINYRRFFDISDLVSLRIEDEDVFWAVHRRVLDLARTGAVTGLRIDHVDGLYDPQGYLNRLQEYLTGEQPDSTKVGAAAAGQEPPGFYVLVEKILEGDEELPASWPVAGTTGYDYLNVLNKLFVDPRGLHLLDGLYEMVTGTKREFGYLVDAQKRRVMRELFPGEMADLTGRLVHLAEQDPLAGETGRNELEEALLGVTAALKVYRTYTRDFNPAPRDRAHIEEALAGAARYGYGSEPARSFLRRVLLLDFTDGQAEVSRQEWLSFVMRWQQFTGPIMAKGYEDTLLYLYNRLISLNEVGGDPAGGGVSVVEFHQQMQARRARLPHTMNATSTHDTKRSEDVRARLNVLSEIPGLWTRQVVRWREKNAVHKPLVHGRPAPGDNAELFIYQTLVGAWPLHAEEEAEFGRRLSEYLIKAAREAKAHTSWLDPDEEYEAAVCQFAQNILADKPGHTFRQELLSLVRPVSFYGAMNSLAQVVLKAVCPGVPDIYQGTELLDFSLVDPDNRRPVDFEQRMAMLEELNRRATGPGLAREILAGWEDGRLKMFVTWKALTLRREQPETFSSGAYIPVDVSGPAQEHVCALVRRLGDSWVLAVVPRLTVRLTAGNTEPVHLAARPPVGGDVWGDTELVLPATAPECWRNLFTGEIYNAATAKDNPGTLTLPLSRVLGTFPVALLTPDNGN